MQKKICLQIVVPNYWLDWLLGYIEVRVWLYIIKTISPCLGPYDTSNCLPRYNDHFFVIVALSITRNDESLSYLYSLECQKKKKKKKTLVEKKMTKLEAKKDIKV